MYAIEIAEYTQDNLLRLLRSLSANRYVAGTCHEVHVFAVAAADLGASEPELSAWAAQVLGSPDIDKASRDPRLTCRVTAAQLVAILRAFWGDSSASARAHLHALLEAADLLTAELHASEPPTFDEAEEADAFPRLVDFGTELLGLSELDADRHRGAINRFEDALTFAAAVHEELSAVPAPEAALIEWPVLGVRELTHPPETWQVPLPIWVQGDARYVDYVVEGALRAAGLAWEAE